MGSIIDPPARSPLVGLWPCSTRATETFWPHGRHCCHILPTSKLSRPQAGHTQRGRLVAESTVPLSSNLDEVSDTVVLLVSIFVVDSHFVRGLALRRRSSDALRSGEADLRTVLGDLLPPTFADGDARVATFACDVCPSLLSRPPALSLARPWLHPFPTFFLRSRSASAASRLTRFANSVSSS